MKVIIELEATSFKNLAEILKVFDHAALEAGYSILSSVRGKICRDILPGDIIFNEQGVKFVVYPIEGWKHEPK